VQASPVLTISRVAIIRGYTAYLFRAFLRELPWLWPCGWAPWSESRSGAASRAIALWANR
jgi:hypothetical protein